jgi:hypothetical protein
LRAVGKLQWPIIVFPERTDEYRYRRFAGQTLPNDDSSSQRVNVSDNALLDAHLFSDKTRSKHIELQTASQLNTAPLCLLRRSSYLVLTTALPEAALVIL